MNCCGRGWWLPLVWLLACAGPGLEPPGDGNQNAGGTGTGAGIGGSSGNFGGGAGGTGGSGGAGGMPGSVTGEPGRDGDAHDPDGPGTDAGGAGELDGGVRYPARELVGPSYLGSLDNGAPCTTSYPTRGHAPDDAGAQRHPLFLYFVGTAFVATDASARYDSPAALAVTEAMARRGFVALSVQYDNGALAWLSDHGAQLACLFGEANASNVLALACALPNVDCELGIAAWGHSQGAYVAAMAHDSDPRVRAVWATGYGGDAPSTLPKDRLRVVNGEADAADNGTAAKLQMITGLSAAECPDPDQCLRADGSGYIIVRKRDLAMPESSSADHCWFDRPSCAAGAIALEPNWIDPDSDKPFALERNADWVAARARQ